MKSVSSEAAILRRVRATVQAHRMLQGGETVVVGVSGGADSTSLLHLLWRLREEYRLKLHVCHVNHLLRGIAADQDAQQVRALARRLSLPCTVNRAQVARLVGKGVSLEEAGRRARYRCFTRLAARIGAARIAVGHTADDRIETVLLNLIRGTGPEGLAGIRPVHDRIIRPLISLRRSETRAYCAAHGLPVREDPSNRDRRFLRNRIRLELLPRLRRLRAGADEALLRLAEIMQAEDELLRQQALAALAAARKTGPSGQLLLDTNQLDALPSALRPRLLREAVRELKGDLLGLEAVHLQALERLAAGPVGKSLRLRDGIWAFRDYAHLRLGRGPVPETEPLKPRALPVPGKAELTELGLVLEAERAPIPTNFSPARERDPLCAALDGTALASKLLVRSWRPGDRFRPLGSPGRMKLQDFFVNQKVPRWLRSRVPLVISGEDIVWAVGYRIDERFKVTAETKEIVTLRARGV